MTSRCHPFDKGLKVEKARRRLRGAFFARQFTASCIQTCRQSFTQTIGMHSLRTDADPGGNLAVSAKSKHKLFWGHIHGKANKSDFFRLSMLKVANIQIAHELR